MKPEDIERVKDLLPTELGSEEIREQIAADILRRSVFSARMTSARYLARIRDVCMRISTGEINAAEAKTRLLSALESMGFSTEDSGAMENPAAERRLDLIVDTQTQMAANVARLMGETPDTLDEYPGWELTRADAPAAPREDWPSRWRAAGESVGWEGAYRRIYHGSGVGISFVALKSSPIWAAIGAGAGGFTDVLGNPYPPFAYGSYMYWRDAPRELCVQLKLIGGDEHAKAPKTPTLSPSDREILDAARRVGWPGMFDDL